MEDWSSFQCAPQYLNVGKHLVLFIIGCVVFRNEINVRCDVLLRCQLQKNFSQFLGVFKLRNQRLLKLIDDDRESVRSGNGQSVENDFKGCFISWFDPPRLKSYNKAELDGFVFSKYFVYFFRCFCSDLHVIKSRSISIELTVVSLTCFNRSRHSLSKAHSRQEQNLSSQTVQQSRFSGARITNKNSNFFTAHNWSIL